MGNFGVPWASAWHTDGKSVPPAVGIQFSRKSMTLGDHEVAGTWVWGYVFRLKAFICRIGREHSPWVCTLVDGCFLDEEEKGIGVTWGCRLWWCLFWWLGGPPGFVLGAVPIATGRTCRLHQLWSLILPRTVSGLQRNPQLKPRAPGFFF